MTSAVEDFVEIAACLRRLEAEKDASADRRAAEPVAEVCHESYSMYGLVFQAPATDAA